MSLRFVWVLTGLLLCVGWLASQNDAKITSKPGPLVVQLCNGTTLRDVTIEGNMEIVTKLGKLTVPTTEIRRVEFGFRVPEEAAGKVERALKELQSDSFPKREAAAGELAALGRLAYPALLKAAKGADLETTRRIEQIVKEIQKKVPAEQLNVNQQDVIQTADLVLTGQITTKTFKARAEHLGELQLQIASMRTLKAAGLADDAKPAEAIPAEAHVNGKYKNLLRKINVPNDKGSYGEHFDYGFYEGKSYAGFNDLPVGYWVYVSPNWYIWKEEGK
jgi:hypothetical protein